jgi:hypothetical protein
MVDPSASWLMLLACVSLYVYFQVSDIKQYPHGVVYVYIQMDAMQRSVVGVWLACHNRPCGC